MLVRDLVWLVEGVDDRFQALPACRIKDVRQQRPKCLPPAQAAARQQEARAWEGAARRVDYFAAICPVVSDGMVTACIDSMLK
jgi:hypothetical protein